MNVSTTSFSPTQVILACILLIMLLSWLIIFSALAIRDYLMKKVDWEDIPAPCSPKEVTEILYETQHHHFVEIAGSAKQQERADSERPSDSGTTLFK
jgi:hypothetical protein